MIHDRQRLSFGLEAQSVIWIDDEGQYLVDYLQAHGYPNAFRGWVNTGFITGISPDGRTLVGYGAGPRGFTGFAVVLAELGEVHDERNALRCCDTQPPLPRGRP